MKQAYAEEYISPEQYKAEFDSHIKCKIQMNVSKIKNTGSTDDMESDLWIYWANESWNFKIFGKNMNIGFMWSDPIFSTANNKNIPEIWEQVFAIIDSDTKEVIRYWKNDYDSYPEIVSCETEDTSYSIILWIGIVIIILWVIFNKIIRIRTKNKKNG